MRQIAQNVSGLQVAPQTKPSEVFGNKDLCLAYCGDVVRAALNYPAVLPPGSRFEVAQENSQLLALVIERAGMMAEILDERFRCVFYSSETVRAVGMSVKRVQEFNAGS